MVHKIIVKSDEVEIYFYVGEKYYKRELAIAGSLALQTAAGGDGISGNGGAAAKRGPGPLLPEKRQSSALPVFHGNPKTSEFLNFKPSELNLNSNFFMMLVRTA